MNYSDVKLIELVRSCPSIYDSKLAEFKIPQRKDETWQNIANQLQITVLECRNRWRTIRERYARELRRHDKNSSWPYFHLMEFLTAYIKPRDISLKLSTSKIKNEFDNKRKFHQDLLLSNDATRLNENVCAAATTNNFVEIEEVYYDDSVDQSNDIDQSEDCDRKRIKRKFSTDDIPNTNYHQTSETIEDKIEDKLFCSSIACTLNKLSRVHNIKAKCEIYKVLEKYIELEER